MDSIHVSQDWAHLGGGEFPCEQGNETSGSINKKGIFLTQKFLNNLFHVVNNYELTLWFCNTCELMSETGISSHLNVGSISITGFRAGLITKDSGYYMFQCY